MYNAQVLYNKQMLYNIIKPSNTLEVLWCHIQSKKLGNKKSRGEGVFS